MKKTWVWIAAVVLIVVLGYAGRHKIKSLMGGSPTAAPVAAKPTETMAPTVAMVKNDLLMERADSAKGNYLADPKGMTLYTFDKDSKGVSTCTGTCATIWPAYGPGSTAPATLPTNITTLKRGDGSMQYAYKGMPLYYYSKDTKAGDLLGDGVGGVWHLAKP